MKPNDPNRYVVRFRNGVWIIFDRYYFEVAETFRTEKLALEKFNAPA